MNFSEFQAKFITENKKLKWAFMGTTIILAIVIFIITLTNHRQNRLGRKIFKERLVLEAICEASFDSLLDQSLKKEIIHKELISILEKEEWSINADEILSLKSFGEDQCKIIMRNTKGKLQSFLFSFIKDEGLPFEYQLIGIDEEEI
jgi:hypothetical protein